VLEHVPHEVTVTVTTSPRRGLEPTLELAERIAGHGYDVVPHLAARHVVDRSHLAEIVERIGRYGATDVLVLAGDAEEPAGEFDGSLPFLRALAELGAPFASVGITGYPERHAFLSDEAAIASLLEKEEFSTYLVTQVCFDADLLADWVGHVWERGVRLAIQIGLPGVVERGRLRRVSERIGVGESLRLLPPDGGKFDPTSLVAGLAEHLARPLRNVAGFHIFTFNDLEETERWRQRTLQRERVP
jgi:methylenetetrahydrofolate reductase (NADPH)